MTVEVESGTAASPSLDNHISNIQPLNLNVSASGGVIDHVEGRLTAKNSMDDGRVTFNGILTDGHYQILPQASLVGIYTLEGYVYFRDSSPEGEPVPPQSFGPIVICFNETHSASAVFAENGRKIPSPTLQDIASPPLFLETAGHQKYVVTCRTPLKSNWLINYLLMPSEGTSFSLLAPRKLKAVLDPKNGGIKAFVNGIELDQHSGFDRPTFRWSDLGGAPYACFAVTLETDSHTLRPVNFLVLLVRGGHATILGRFRLPQGWKIDITSSELGITTDEPMEFGGIAISTHYTWMDPQKG